MVVILQAFSELFFISVVLKSANYLHNSMLHSIFRCRMGFFESTPVGRIINRFSKDMEAIEEIIPDNYKLFVQIFFLVIVRILTIIVSSPYFLIPLVPIVTIYVLTQVILPQEILHFHKNLIII